MFSLILFSCTNVEPPAFESGYISAFVYNFFKQYLTPPSVATGLNDPVQLTVRDMQLDVSPNPTIDNVQLTFILTTPGKVTISVYNLSGILLHKTEKQYTNTGLQRETIEVDKLNLSQGIYFVKVTTNGMQGIKKFMKK